MKAPLATLALLAALTAVPAAAQTGSGAGAVGLTFQGIEQPRGAVMFAVFDNAEAYAGRGAPVRGDRVEVTGATAVARLEGLAPGRYAIKAFHDLDGDGTMDTNPFGLPTEPYAFSNDAPARFGPPGFAAAAFTVGAGDTVHTITLR